MICPYRFGEPFGLYAQVDGFIYLLDAFCYKVGGDASRFIRYIIIDY